MVILSGKRLEREEKETTGTMKGTIVSLSGKRLESKKKATTETVYHRAWLLRLCNASEKAVYVRPFLCSRLTRVDIKG
jgi:hypothetical protein